MRIRPPSSRAAFRVRLSSIDICLAASSPLLALYLRDAYILSYEGATTTVVYCVVSLTFSLMAFVAFGIREGTPRYFCVRDTINIAKAVVIGELTTCVMLFTLTRLEGVPRSTPVIHALLLGVGLVAARGLARFARADRGQNHRRDLGDQHIILVGLNDLSVFYMNFLELFGSGRSQVIAVLDRDPQSISRWIDGIQIVGPPAHLRSVVEEFAVHGVRTDRVVVGGGPDILSGDELQEIERVCAQKAIDLEFVPRLFDLNAKQLAQRRTRLPEVAAPAPPHSLPNYIRLKRFVDFFAALVMIFALSPLWTLVAALAFLDVGSPILFWQQRTGLNGRSFLVYKIRTLRPPFDCCGQPLREKERLSRIGRLLRETRLDELPQLLNVLVGDMSLIGPRPLLPCDQPPSPTLRLTVRPGITGWAQVNGAALLSPKEKNKFDEWYIRNASPLLDLYITGLTLLQLVEGLRR